MSTPIAPVAPDTTPPGAPGSLGATAASASQIDLSWTAATDNVGVTGYRVERCQGAGCTAFAQIATPTGTSFSDTGLAAGTSYSYRVRATDAAANLGAYSNLATTSTTAPDTTATDGARQPGRDRGEREPDQPELDGSDRQRGGERLPRRALPGRGLHQLRASGHARPPRASTTAGWRHRPATATACGPSMPRATRAAIPASPRPRPPARRRPPGWWRPTASRKARAARSPMPRATATPAPSPARPGARRAATAERSSFNGVGQPRAGGELRLAEREHGA